jgi:predicted nucleotide-binding protein
VTFQQVFEKNEKTISNIESECAVVSFEYKDIKSTKKQKQKISVHKQISLLTLRQAFRNFAMKEMRKISVSSSDRICRKEEAEFLIRKVTSTYWYNLSKYKKLLIHYAHFR